MGKRSETARDLKATGRIGSALADQDLASAERVLTLAAEGLQAIASGLGPELTAALDLIAATSGRVIVTGMGKSGHIARKLSATFASTGTPSHFVHPAEAGHGDLGMITPGDVVIALSNSGETAELDPIIAYAKRFEIPLIALTGGRTSSLAEAADVLLILPGLPEACPLGLAPTTSTTMMLAYGDALAVAMLERRGFTAQDYQVLHPGGSLGRKLIRVADLMHKGGDIPLATPDQPMSAVVLEMTSKKFGCVGLVDEAGRLIGIITDGDLRRHMGDDLLTRPAGDIMTKRPVTIRPQALAAEALGLMTARGITKLFALEDGRPVGFIETRDCLRAGVA